MEIKVVEAEGIIPGGRCMHTIKAVAEKWLAVFGGRRIAYENNGDDEPIYYDTKDLYLFYIPYATWIFPTTLYSTPYPRSYPACAAVDSALYIYGGQQLIFTTGSRREGDDHKELNASFSKVESAACESRRYLKDSVHDDENLWCFRIHDFRPDLSSSVMFKTSQKLGTLHSGTINDATATTSINSNFPASEQPSRAHSSVPFWEKHISPRANSFFSGRRQEWVMTRGESVGRCCGAAMVGTAKKLILFGGWDKDRWNLEENTYEAKKKCDSFISGSEFANRSSDSKEINNGSLENTGSLNTSRNMQSRELSQSSHQALQYSRMNQSLYFTQHQSQSQPTSHLCLPLFNDSSPKGTYNTTRPWEFLRIYLLERNYWIHLRVKGLPEMECVAFLSDNSTHSNGLFVVGRTRDASNRIIMGWIKDE
ncbi:4508_t:CDS:2 [Paraglomus brasilianum]|uniref:4508_t:CDS:1 n=1 Tax=Paraglomus brasilianum TaxID=144538 RepID=A0A9N8ZW71_9GLOM|nr:4508_t:CDS:2 [Paraglomus brasilianum]